MDKTKKIMIGKIGLFILLSPIIIPSAILFAYFAIILALLGLLMGGLIWIFNLD